MISSGEQNMLLAKIAALRTKLTAIREARDELAQICKDYIDPMYCPDSRIVALLLVGND